MLVQIFKKQSPQNWSPKYAILTNRKLCLYQVASSGGKTKQTKQLYFYRRVFKGRIFKNNIETAKVFWEEWFESFMVMNSATLSNIFHNCVSSVSHGFSKYCNDLWKKCIDFRLTIKFDGCECFRQSLWTPIRILKELSPDVA